MSSRAELHSIVPLAMEPAVRSLAADIAAMRPRANIEVRAVTHAPASPKQRTRIWDLHNSLHCSIIGTCLTSGELRRLLVRLNVKGADTADDHDLHMLGVMLASRPQAGAKILQKTLDRRHEMALRQFARAKDTAAICALWEDAMRRGDIPGAYWALLTHPVTTDAMVKQAFGEVHMLSHLVGAANRADIRRLRQLEEDNAALAATLERQQKQLRDGFTSRDETIRRLTDALARKAGDNVAAAGTADDVGALVVGACRARAASGPGIDPPRTAGAPARRRGCRMRRAQARQPGQRTDLRGASHGTGIARKPDRDNAAERG